nr:ankyrin-1-like [Lytechinus pictus]
MSFCLRTRETGKLQVASGGNVSTEFMNGRRESNTEGGKSGCSTVAPPSRSDTDEKDGSLEIHQGDLIFPAKTSNDNDASVGLHEITPTMEVGENANVLNVEADQTGQGPLDCIAVADEIPMGGDAIASRRETTSNPKIDRTDEEGNTPVYNAASKGNLKGVEDLISQGANLNKPSNRGRCPLHVAAERGHGNIVNLLISRGAEVQVECDIGQTPIHKAAANGHTFIVESLIAHRSNINSEDQTEWTPFNAAIQHGHLETLKFLLRKEANQNVHNGRTPLYAAAEFGHLEILQFLISKGANMKRENPSGRIPLHGAAINGDMEIIKYLIQAGSDVNKGTPKGFTPLDAAIKYGHLEAIKYLMDEGSKLKRYDGMTPLYVAAKFGHLDIVEFFISEGADVEEENDSGEIPLHGAAFSSKMEVIKYLIQRGSDVNKADVNGRTPFNAAVQYGHLDAVKYLIEKGAKQNTFDGINPLYAAAQFGHLDIVKFFISEGADVNGENDKGMIPLHGAASRGHIEVMEYLLQQGSDVNKGLAKSWAPIHAAIAYGQLEAVENLWNYAIKQEKCQTKRLLHAGVKFGHFDLVQFLISKEADINETYEDGNIPPYHAAYGAHLKVMEYLIQQGSDVNKADVEGWTPPKVSVQRGHLQAVKYPLEKEGKLSISSGCGVKERVTEMQSRAEQQAILPNEIVNGKDDILANTAKKRRDELSSNVLSEDAEKDGREERNSFLSAKLKSPDEREESQIQLWLESIKKDRADNRNTIPNTKNNFIRSEYRTWGYESSNSPFLHEMRSHHRKKSEPFPLTDETRETQEPSSSWSSMNAGSNIPVRGTSSDVISPGRYTLRPDDDPSLSRHSGWESGPRIRKRDYPTNHTKSR